MASRCHFHRRMRARSSSVSRRPAPRAMCRGDRRSDGCRAIRDRARDRSRPRAGPGRLASSTKSAGVLMPGPRRGSRWDRRSPGPSVHAGRPGDRRRRSQCQICQKVDTLSLSLFSLLCVLCVRVVTNLALNPGRARRGSIPGASRYRHRVTGLAAVDVPLPRRRPAR